MEGENDPLEKLLEECVEVAGQKPRTYILPFRHITSQRHQLGEGQHDVQCLVVLLLGLIGAGKSKLVDVLGNYGMGVSFRDPYRFQVKEDGPTEKITSHTFFTRDERRFPRPVTLIDTPGLQKGNPKDDKKLMEDIRAFIQHHHQQGIHAVIYVAPNSQGRLTAEQKIVLGNMANILGDKTEKISYLFCTFADGKSLPVLKSVKEAGLKYQKHFAVNSSSYFSVVEEEDGSSIDDDEGKSKEVGGESMNELLWKLTTDSIEDFVMGIQKNQPIQTQEILSSGEENEEKKNGKSRRSSEEVEKVPLITGGRFPQPAGEDPDPSIGQRSFCGRIRRSFKSPWCVCAMGCGVVSAVLIIAAGLASSLLVNKYAKTL